MMFLRSIVLLVAAQAAMGFAPATSSFKTSLTRVFNAPTHDVRGSGEQMEIDPEEAKIQAAFAEHQQNAPKLGWATDVRTLVA